MNENRGGCDPPSGRARHTSSSTVVTYSPLEGGQLWLGRRSGSRGSMVSGRRGSGGGGVCTRRCGQGGKDEILGGFIERAGRHGRDQIGGVVVFGLHHRHHAGGRLTRRVVRLEGGVDAGRGYNGPEEVLEVPWAKCR